MNKYKAISIADELCENHSARDLQLVASILFQRTLEFKNKIKWMSSEDDLLSTFFYLSSKEELCEAFQCTMEALYSRARHLGVVSPTFETLNSSDLSMALSLFQEGKSQEDILDLLGINSPTVPVRALTINDYEEINSALSFADDAQMGYLND